ncbi:L-amino acid N-acyltransferase YncA [Chitinophaga skermanii]|uniref:L-amino acid N-acyltransferase YncA n=1 Tax=Chitinophaga skermanii TaxID=331697 RepID=A0A327QQ40_9BACT|nr:GNAT family N-acetyltransferase [Chitinophaga skermanii]RAJ05463.1 L-amino acid N-acyltransferase YncA [Chitinophaga skermanii]
MIYAFRQATIDEIDQIWTILQQAILRRKNEGSQQWQDGYPNPEVVRNDITQGHGFVYLENGTIVGYVAILINDEPAYAGIEGKWLSEGDFVVYHRVAIDEHHLGKGLAIQMLVAIEEYALQQGIYSVKADTNFDNKGMLRIFEKLGYTYCGEVYFRGAPRRAYEKLLSA